MAGLSDTAWLKVGTPVSLPHITVVLGLDAPLSPAALSQVRSRLSRLVDPPRLRLLPAPVVHRRASTIQEVAEESLAHDPSPHLWEVWNVETTQGAFLLLRLHHTLGDGARLLALLRELVDTPLARTPVSVPLSLWRKSYRILDAPRATGALLSSRRPTKPALTGRMNVALSPAWDLEPLKVQARTAGVSLNTLLVKAVAEACALPGDEHLHVGIPVAQDPRERNNNRFTLAVARVVRSESLDTLAGHTRKLYASGQLLVTRAAFQLGGVLPSSGTRLLARILGRRMDVIFSNVRGPQERMVLGGQEITSVHFLIPRIGDVALGMTAFSWNGHLYVGVGADDASGHSAQEVLARLATFLKI